VKVSKPDENLLNILVNACRKLRIRFHVEAGLQVGANPEDIGFADRGCEGSGERAVHFLASNREPLFVANPLR